MSISTRLGSAARVAHSSLPVGDRQDGILTGLPMHRIDVYRMIRRRAADATFHAKIGCHTFRATGIIAYLEAGGTHLRTHRPWPRTRARERQNSTIVRLT
jgi:hypothetical protein